MLDFEATYEAIHSGVVARQVSRDVVVVTGPDAKSYLQGQVTQDLDALQAGEAAETLLLSPQESSRSPGGSSSAAPKSCSSRSRAATAN